MILRLGALGLGLACAAAAQEAINTDAAVQPSTGSFVIREQLMVHRAHRDPFGGQEDVTEWMPMTLINYGIFHDLAASVRIPLRYRTGDTLLGARGVDEQLDVGDLGVRLKWRVLQRDPGALQTERLSLIGGVEFDTGDNKISLNPDFADGSTNPTLGLAYTRISGRWGVGGSAEWEFQTDGDSDAARVDAAVLYRISPTQFHRGDAGAWYGMVESNTRYDTNGDIETFVSPGLMYEGTTWTYEASIMLPVARELDRRAETDAILVFGVRMLF